MFLSLYFFIIIIYDQKSIYIIFNNDLQSIDISSKIGYISNGTCVSEGGSEHIWYLKNLDYFTAPEDAVYAITFISGASATARDRSMKLEDGSIIASKYMRQPYDSISAVLPLKANTIVKFSGSGSQSDYWCAYKLY